MPTIETDKTKTKIVGGPAESELDEIETPDDTEDPDLEASETDDVEDIEGSEDDEIYEVNGKKFSSAKEMSEYVAGLEKLAFKKNQDTTTNPNQKQPLMMNGKPVSEALFEDPEGFVEFVTNKALTAQQQAETIKEENRKHWETFYKSNPDLKGKETLVNALLNQNAATLKDLSIPEGSKILAKMTRSELKKMGLTTSKASATTLEKSESGTVSSTKTAVVTKKETKAPLGFIDQMKALRSKQAKSN